jgi:hypothetical protein
MIFDAATDSVTVQTLDGEPVETLAPARAAFKGMLRNTDWDAPHLGYFLGYACWNYFTSPFLFTYPGVRAREIEPWHEAGQTWRRLQAGHHQNFDGLVMPTRQRMFRRNPDNSVNLNFPSITVDVHGVELVRADDEQVRP